MSDSEPNNYVDRLVDEDALDTYLTGRLGAADTYEVVRHSAGHSNETLFVTWGNRELVVRRPPAGETADTAHDVLREYHVIDALQETDVPVPPTVLACDDHSILGCDFYVMERVEGDVLRKKEPERFSTPARRSQLGAELVDGLAAIHEIDYEDVGLDDLGRPAGYTQRQIDRWEGQLDWAVETTARKREVPKLHEVTKWLHQNAPDSHDAVLVHGDYKLDNVMFSPASTPDLTAIFDWEMSTLGDPLADLGWLLAFWRNADDPERAIPELVPTFPEREGYPSRGDIVVRYENQTGRSFDQQQFYRALGVYKLAVLGEMFYARHLNGDSDDPMYPAMRDRVPALADRSLRIIEGDEPL